MKSILMSIQPEYCELIASGKKTIEVRKTAPKAPFRVFIYQTKKKWIYRLLEWLGLYQQKVIGEFVCNAVESIPVDSEAFAAISKPACLTTDELIEYCSGKDMYGLHISDLKVYDKPKELSDFYSIKQCKPWTWEEPLARPPQSWQYVETPDWAEEANHESHKT